MLLWTLFTLVIGFLRIYISDGGVTEARCNINCMTSLQMLNTNQSITACENNLNCSSCLKPCSLEYRSRSSCEARCELASNTDVCFDSCSYLKLITNQNSGSCPLQEDIVKFGKACLEVCSDDAGCKKSEKCCDNGCGHTCQQALINTEDYPPKPERRHIFVEENDDAASVRIGWLPREPPDPGEVLLYIVQGRNHSGENFRKRLMGAWYTQLVTPNLEADVHLDVGRFYQFQVAVVNINGSRGYSRVTAAIKLSRNPTQPNPPENVMKGRSVLKTTGKVNVVISWDPPEASDLELIRYRIFWSIRPEPSPHIQALEEYKMTVIAPVTSCELIELEQNTIYYIQVQSVARWGTIRKFSNRASVYIRVEDFSGNSHHEPISGDIDWEGPGPVADMHRSETYWDGFTLLNDISWQKPIGYESSVDRFTIHWKPMQCYNQIDESTMKATVQRSTTFPIYDLVFDCTYLVWIVPVAGDQDDQLGHPAYISFTTPPCSEVIIAGTPRPVCPTIAPDLPSAPLNVSHMFIIGTEIAVNISWQAPSYYTPPLTGYRIVSAKYRPHPTNFFRQGFPVLHSSYTVTVNTDCRHVILEDLEMGMRYIVTVSATNSIGGGDLAILDIKTPIVSVPINPTPPPTESSIVDFSEAKIRTTPTYSSGTTLGSSGVTVSLSLPLLCIGITMLCALHLGWR